MEKFTHLPLPGKLIHFGNPAAAPSGQGYSEKQKSIISMARGSEAAEDIEHWPGYSATPLLRLTSLASEVGLGELWHKDESKRFGLKSFKALGGAYAVGKVLQKIVEDKSGHRPSLASLLQGGHRAHTSSTVLTTATDGNHGRSVAWGARMFGCPCVVYMPEAVSQGRQAAVEAFGAKVVRTSGNYDESVVQADKDARTHGRVVISDTSYAGYTDIPKDVMNGYTVMMAEIVQQLEDNSIPTHVFIQGGVGGLAAAVCGHFWEVWAKKRPRLIVVEPELANCLQESARAGRCVTVGGTLDTLMAGLSCGEVSELAWDILSTGTNDFLTLSEEAVPAVMKLLARGDPKVEAGESAVAGLAAAILAKQDPKMAVALGLDSESRVLVIGTEGATDPEMYQQLVG